MIFGVNKFPARKHHISLNVLWCAESNGYINAVVSFEHLHAEFFWPMWSDEVMECVLTKLMFN
jgi:hypothetical protein